LVDDTKDLLSGDRNVMMRSDSLPGCRPSLFTFFLMGAQENNFFRHPFDVIERNNIARIVLNKVWHPPNLIKTDNRQTAIGRFQANQRNRIFACGQEEYLASAKIAPRISRFSNKKPPFCKTELSDFVLKLFKFPCVDSDPKEMSVFQT